MIHAVRSAIAAVLLVAAAVAGTAAAQTVSAESVPEREVRTLPVSTSVPVTTCPGPQTLLAPPGARPVAPPGPVVVSAVATGQATLGGLVPPRAGQPPEPADPQPLTSGSTRVGDGSTPVRLLTQRRTAAGAVRFDVARTRPGVAAPASSGVQATLGVSGDLRGLAATGCGPAVAQSWLVGGGTGDGERSRLVLTNPTPSPALLDVLVHGPDGVVKAPSGEGIVVAAGDQEVLFVDALAPGLDQVAVQVSARTGRVVASMQHSRILGFTPAGVDDVTASTPPATTQLVPGVVLKAPGRAVVRVVAPGPDEAVVRVSLIGVASATPDDAAVDTRPARPQDTPATSGPAAPVVVNVPGRAVRDVPLTGIPDGTYVAVVSSDVPVAAGAVSTLTLPGGELAGTPQALGRTVPPTDLAWAPSAAPLRGAVAVAVAQFSGAATPVTASLVLAAPTGAARVELRQVSVAARAGRASALDLADGQVAVVDLSAGTAAVLLATAGEVTGEPDGRLVAALLLRGADDAGPLLSVVPLQPGRASTGTAPQVVEDPQLGVGAG